MEENDFVNQIGKLTYSYVRIDLLISNIAFELKLNEQLYDFFADTRFADKLEKLINMIRIAQLDTELKNKLIDWLNKVDDCRKKRNIVIHSIILNNVEKPNELKAFNYKKLKGKIIREIHDFTIQDLNNLNEYFVDIHNEGIGIYDKIINVA